MTNDNELEYFQARYPQDFAALEAVAREQYWSVGWRKPPGNATAPNNWSPLDDPCLQRIFRLEHRNHRLRIVLSWAIPLSFFAGAVMAWGFLAGVLGR